MLQHTGASGRLVGQCLVCHYLNFHFHFSDSKTFFKMYNQRRQGAMSVLVTAENQLLGPGVYIILGF